MRLSGYKSKFSILWGKLKLCWLGVDWPIFRQIFFYIQKVLKISRGVFFSYIWYSCCIHVCFHQKSPYPHEKKYYAGWSGIITMIAIIFFLRNVVFLLWIFVFWSFSLFLYFHVSYKKCYYFFWGGQSYVIFFHCANLNFWLYENYSPHSNIVFHSGIKKN